MNDVVFLSRPRLRPCQTRGCGTWGENNSTQAWRSGYGPSLALLHNEPSERMLSGELCYPSVCRIIHEGKQFYLKIRVWAIACYALQTVREDALRWVVLSLRPHVLHERGNNSTQAWRQEYRPSLALLRKESQGRVMLSVSLYIYVLWG